MPVVPTTAYAPSEDALNLTRSLVNDSAGVVFTDALLMPFLNSAYRGLQRELAENGVSVLTEQQDIEMDVNGGTGVTNTELSDVSSPQLPTDCLSPHMLWERATASTSDVFVPMEKFMSGGSMLNLQPGSYLRLWEWREDKVNLIGATQSITVRIRYEKVLPALTLGTDPVQIRSATDPLAFATAALAARSRGARALAQDLLATAQMATENLIERYVRPEQTKGRRRMPYGYRRRVIYCSGAAASPPRDCSAGVSLAVFDFFSRCEQLPRQTREPKATSKTRLLHVKGSGFSAQLSRGGKRKAKSRQDAGAAFTM